MCQAPDLTGKGNRQASEIERQGASGFFLKARPLLGPALPERLRHCRLLGKVSRLQFYDRNTKEVPNGHLHHSQSFLSGSF